MSYILPLHVRMVRWDHELERAVVTKRVDHAEPSRVLANFVWRLNLISPDSRG